MKTFGSMLLLTLCAFAQQAGTKAVPQASGDAAFRKLADRYFDEVYFKFNPTQGTAAGFHQYDPQFEDLSSQTIGAQIGRCIASELSLIRSIREGCRQRLAQTVTC